MLADAERFGSAADLEHGAGAGAGGGLRGSLPKTHGAGGGGDETQGGV